MGTLDLVGEDDAAYYSPRSTSSSFTDRQEDSPSHPYLDSLDTAKAFKDAGPGKQVSRLSPPIPHCNGLPTVLPYPQKPKIPGCPRAGTSATCKLKDLWP